MNYLKMPILFTVLAMSNILNAQLVVDNYTNYNINGHDVLVNHEALTSNNFSLTKVALNLLEDKLLEIADFCLEDDIFKELQEIPIFMDWETTNGAAVYHSSGIWLSNNGYEPKKEKAVEISNIKNFIDWSVTNQPYMVLHELAHAYHDRKFGFFNNTTITNAYFNAKTNDLYQSVDYHAGNGTIYFIGEAYALNNEMEFFSELTEAYFGYNDYYPFDMNDLKNYDPVGFSAMERIWGTKKIRITSPENGSKLASGKSVTVKVDICDTAGIVEKVEFALNGVYTNDRQVNSTPYELTFSNLPVGANEIKVKSIYDSGVFAESSVTIYVEESGDHSNYVSIPALIEAEDYTDQKGIDTQDTKDPDGGVQNVGWTHTNDYLTYDINVPASGEYTVKFRVAAKSSNIKFDVYQNENKVGSINATPTGDYQKWTTVSTKVDLTKGNQTIKLLATGGGWNINWLEFVESEIISTGDYVSIPALIEAEDYVTERGIKTEETKDQNGGNLNVGWFDANDYLTYDINVPFSGEYTVTFSVAAKSSNIKFDVYQNENKIGAINEFATGDYQAWKTVSTKIDLNKGNQTIKLLATGGGWNINWLAFEENDVIEEVSCTSGTNLSLNGTVAAFSSEQNTTNTVNNILDGKTNNRWSASGLSQYVVVDLGDSYNVNKINLDTYGNRDYNFTVEGSTTSASSGYSALTDGSGSTRSSFPTKKVRYVKLTITGANSYTGSWVSIHNFEIICAGNSSRKKIDNNQQNVVEVTAFPNPFISSINVEANSTNQTIGSLQLVDLTGEVVASQEGKSISNLDQVANGVYLLQILNVEEQIIAVKKVVKE